MKKELFILVMMLGLLASSASNVLAINSENFSLKVYMSTQGEDVNAFGGTLNYPNSWAIRDIKIEGPSLLYWVTKPTLKEFGTMDFSAIVPGGVSGLNMGGSDLLLFTVEFLGVAESQDEVSFTTQNFYLNHPTALVAADASFNYKISYSNYFQDEVSADLLKGVNTAFVKDPVTQAETLVVDSYRGDLGEYFFRVKEGDFGLGDWKEIDGISALASVSSTVQLQVISPDGEETKINLRRSLLAQSVILTGGGLGSLFLLYLFYSAYQLATLRPQDIKKASRSQSLSSWR